MPRFWVTQYIYGADNYEVEAESRADAVMKVLRGDLAAIKTDSLSRDADEDRGVSVEEEPELAEELRQLGVDVDEGFIPSIDSVGEM